MRTTTLKDSLSEEDFQALTDVYQSMIEKEKWDKIFVVLPQSNYGTMGFGI